MTGTSVTPETWSRLLAPTAGTGPLSLAEHVEHYGPLPAVLGPDPGWRQAVVAEIELSGLQGRGGAGFPAARKARSVQAAGPGPVIVVNAMEAEPASLKDQVLLSRSPHLVLDGAVVLAGALSASRTVVCLPADRPALARLVRAAIDQRDGADGAGAPIDLRVLDARFVAGEESALVAALSGRPGIPSFRPDKAHPLALKNRAALVHNAETMAHLALIFRYGQQWFRLAGTEEAPGTCLVTISGAVERPGVVEVEIGTPLDAVISSARPSWGTQAVLVGGYGGSWVPAVRSGTPFAPADLAALGASMGAGVLAVLPTGACGLAETARVLRYLASQSAGQCGPCLFGLPAIADDFALLARGVASSDVLSRLRARGTLVAGRGGCRHPDGAVRLARSALDVFHHDVRAHVAGQPCPASAHPGVLTVPEPAARTSNWRTQKGVVAQ